MTDAEYAAVLRRYVQENRYSGSDHVVHDLIPAIERAIELLDPPKRRRLTRRQLADLPTGTVNPERL